MTYKFINQQCDLTDIIVPIMSKDRWAVDTETTGLCPHTDRVVMLQIGDKDIQYVIDTRRVNIEPLRPFFESTTIRKFAHNAKFDYKMLRGSFDISMENIRDTYLAEKIITMGSQLSGFKLDDIVKKYTGIEISKDVRSTFGKGEITGDFTKEQIEYGALDVKYILEAAKGQIEVMTADSLTHVWVLECRALPAFGDMEFDGLYLNAGKWTEIMNENLAKATAIKEELDAIASGFVQRTLFGDVDINYASPEQVTRLLQAMKVKVKVRGPGGVIEEKLITKTDDKTLKQIKDLKIVDLIRKFRSYMIRVNTYGMTYINAINPKTGRLHPEVEQIGTETGRPANRSKKNGFSLLSIPREKAVRNCFHGAPDELVETDDYSGCELRIWAKISGDPGLIEPLKKKVDLHCAVASRLFGKIVKKSDPERTPAKAINFGIAYGMGAYSLFERLNASDYPIELGEARALFRNYNDSYHIGVSFLRDAGKQALRDGYLQNMIGRRRYWRLPDPENYEKYPEGREDKLFLGSCAAIEREGGNFLIQSVNADMTKLAMTLIREYAKKNKVRTHFMNQVYDEIVTRTHKDDSPGFHEAKQKIMIEAAQRFLDDVPMEVDGHVGDSWTK